jgi:hypothetical protein
VYVHDDEDLGGSRDKSNEYRVWRLRLGEIDELDDPYFSPIVPNFEPA